MSDSKHFLVMAGGTGGHVVPGLSVAKELISRGHSVSWMGTVQGIEAELVPNAGIEIDYIQISGVRGKGFVGLLVAPLKIVKAIYQASSIVKRRNPVAVLGMGGFAAGPGGVAAKLKSIPLLIHEQNAKAGTTNKILSKMANKVLQAFPGAFGGAAEIVGNPVRDDLKLNVREVHSGKVNVLILGGSLGALAINDVMPAVFSALKNDISVWHQTGKKHVQHVADDYKKRELVGSEYKVSAFISDMAEAYRWADLVVCRSGAMTVSEVACASKPAIFIPFPFAIDDHQTANAMWMVNAGAALLLQQSEMSKEKLITLIREFIDDKDRLVTMAEAAHEIRITDAAIKVANYCEELAA